MRFLSLTLTNYIGIYNGLGLRQIKIDFTKCRHKIIIIRGDNGSGKSTIMKALSVLPDDNSSFCPDLDASKEITLMEGMDIYQIMINHPTGNNGSRGQAKAYIYKNGTNLNPNGNIRSYKSIVFNEFGLDDNFEALSAMSLNDRGLADKKPAERKRFVSSILSSMDVYNDIYKTVTKQVNAQKGIIGSISSKLNNLGDVNTLTENLKELEFQINLAQSARELDVLSYGEKQARLNMIDPDHDIKSRYDDLERQSKKHYKAMAELHDKLIKLYNTIKNMGVLTSTVSDVTVQMIDELEACFKSNLADVSATLKLRKAKLEDLLVSRETQTQDLQRRVANLKKYTGDTNYEHLLYDIDHMQDELDDIADECNAVLSTGVSSDEIDFVLGTIDYIKELIEYISSEIFPDPYDKNEAIFHHQDYINITPFKKDYDDKHAKLLEFNAHVPSLIATIEAISSLDKRPEDCKNDECPYIADAIKKSKEFYAEQNNWGIDRLYPDASIEQRRTELEDAEKEALKAYEKAMKHAEFKEKFDAIAREFKRILHILKKLPIKSVTNPDYDEITLSTASISNVQNLNDLRSEIYYFSTTFSFVELYNKFKAKIAALTEEKIAFESKMDIIEDLNADIAKINADLNDIAKKIEDYNDSIFTTEVARNDLEETLEEIKKLRKLYTDYEAELKAYNDSINAIAELKSQLSDVKTLESEIGNLATKLNNTEKTVAPLKNQRDNINHSLKLIDEYKNELMTLQTEYNTLELVRKYSSPSTGIQLVFMELYMGKVISFANNLLSLLFGGNFVILPFIINESEFRIPCQGNGYVNDDISSTSSAQLCMISMILSFSLLCNSATRYNIIRLDEIDAPLDETNRALFLDVLNKIMDIMHTEQCIMISHNSELDIEDSDIILLKNSTGYDYNAGNVIWNYDYNNYGG